MSCRILRAVVLVVAVILPLQVALVAAGTPPVPTITAITAGGAHTCALTAAGIAMLVRRHGKGPGVAS